MGLVLEQTFVLSQKSDQQPAAFAGSSSGPPSRGMRTQLFGRTSPTKARYGEPTTKLVVDQMAAASDEEPPYASHVPYQIHSHQRHQSLFQHKRQQHQRMLADGASPGPGDGRFLNKSVPAVTTVVNVPVVQQQKRDSRVDKSPRINDEPIGTEWADRASDTETVHNYHSSRPEIYQTDPVLGPLLGTTKGGSGTAGSGGGGFTGGWITQVDAAQDERPGMKRLTKSGQMVYAGEPETICGLASSEADEEYTLAVISEPEDTLTEQVDYCCLCARPTESRCPV
ncbi:unnamed protein product [Protopolystoma xenopodis]|uniref:Uncharacterized protein n=1 Tax=Protopolystoma xenopodis TaxID=117903 RepID=A0A448XL21_9PLAT|nr:unnamed protein product [Protopolystoma xenopodis]